MTVATATETVELSDIVESNDDAEIAAGFNDEPIPTQEAVAPAPTPDPSSAPDTPVSLETPAPTTLNDQQIKELLAGVTKIQEIEATFGKKFNESFGRIGQLQQAVKELTPSGSGGALTGITADDFKELTAEFPELSVPLLKELIPALKKMGRAEPFDETRIMALVAEQSSKLREETARDLLTDQREDWEAIVGPAEAPTLSPFRQWLAVQPLDYQQKVRSTFRPGIMVKAIEHFEAFQAATTPAPAGEATAKSKAKSTTAADRQARLEAAVAPKGKPAPVGGSAKTADEEMADGYNSA